MGNIILCIYFPLLGRFTEHITEYSVIIPRKVKPSGAFESFHLQQTFSESTRRKVMFMFIFTNLPAL